MVPWTPLAFFCAIILAGQLTTGEQCTFEDNANYKVAHRTVGACGKGDNPADGNCGRRQGALVTAGDKNYQSDSLSCCDSCRRMGQNKCNVWVWCGNTGGCDDGAGTVYPFQGCDLKLQSLQKGQQPAAWARGEGKTTFTSGTVDYGTQASNSIGVAPPQLQPNPSPGGEKIDSVCVKDSSWTITQGSTTYYCIPHPTAAYCTSPLHSVGYCRHADNTCHEGDGPVGSGPCVKRADGSYDNWCC